MSLNDYKLSCELVGHSMDVRAIDVADDFIVSGSRDKTAKIWRYDGNKYSEYATLTNHTNFVSSVCILNGGEWICTGSNDSTICVYSSTSIEPFTVLRGHTSTVSALSSGTENGILMSGSWDKTARVWKISGFGESSSITLNGHEAAVWAVVALKTGKFVTGSADKSIIYWNSSGEKLKILKGHKDCVRGLLALPNDVIISAGNDAVIKIWNEDGECIEELHGHTNYIYSIAFNKYVGEDVIVSGGEDSTLRMWNSKGELGNALTLPAQSVWAVASLRNGDIVTGTSDGIIRIFTRDSNRVADEVTLKSFEEARETRIREANASLGGVKVNELPGPEALLHKGKENQTKMIRHPDGKIICYQWSNGKWNSLGDVVGAAGGTQESSGKTLHEGKEYDYVFSVDISENSPAIKLPYNRGEDPWIVAQKFIHKHDLPQAYLEQVANFIITNSSSAPVVETTASSSYYDPFTGGSRYVPNQSSDFQIDSGNVDPFTGGSSYTTQNRPQVQFTSSSGRNADPFTKGSSHTTTPATNQSSSSKHFPITEYTIIDTCDPSKVLEKLKSFNQAIADPFKVTENELNEAIQLATGDISSIENSIQSLKKLLKWPKENLFPILDILRLGVRNEEICAHLITQETLNIVLENINNPPACQLMSIRCLSNMLQHETGRKIVLSILSNAFIDINSIKHGSANLQIAVSTLFLNLAVTQIESADEAVSHQMTEAISNFCLWSTDAEAFYRCLRSVGNLLSTTFSATISALIVSADHVMSRIMQTSDKVGHEKINEISREILTKIQN